jgi:hypothetical protein
MLQQLPATAFAQSIRLSPMSMEHCIDEALMHEDESDPRNQRYWFPRVPPLVGYNKGERTTAGGDGTCFVGFPLAASNSARVNVNGKLIDVTVDAHSTQGNVQIYRSRANRVILTVTKTSSETTCDPNLEKSCGDYTYATIKLQQAGRTTFVKGARYVGS